MNILSEYCHTNKLQLNVNKTKIMKFFKGKPRRERSFTYEGNEVEMVKSYNYLGVMFSSSGLFLQATEEATSRGNSAIGSVIDISCRAKLNSWEVRQTLINAIMTSSLLYSVQVWGLRYMDALEQANLNTYRKLFWLPRNTASYILRLETDSIHISWKILRNTLNWYIKLLQMEEKRYPRICLMKLKQLFYSTRFPTNKYNWYAQVRGILQQIGEEDILLSLNPGEVRNKSRIILEKYKTHLHNIDENKLLNSQNYTDHYIYIHRKISDHNRNIPTYLTVQTNFKYIKLLTQLRLSNNFCIKISMNNSTVRIDPQSLCQLCNRNEKETLYHIFHSCPIYNNLRRTCFGNTNSPHTSLLDPQTELDIKKVYYYISGVVGYKQLAF